jgi:glucan biosynthesis protein C
MRFRISRKRKLNFTDSSAEFIEQDLAQSVGRQLFIDNLRWTTIILVISMHAADTYSPLGNWYFVDRRPISVPTFVFFAAWQMYLQAFFMGMLFLIAGYFVPHSFDRKGPWMFMRDRLYRLGLPVLLYMLVIGPITEYFVARSWTSTVPTSFAHEWFKHIQNGEVLQENGPLWFCVALLIFSAVYAVIRVAKGSTTSKASSNSCPVPVQIVCFGLLMALATFLTRLSRPSSVFNLPLGDFSQYVLMFGAGILAARRQWMSRIRLVTGVRFLIVCLIPGLAVWYAMLFLGAFFRGDGSAFYSGLHWQNAAFATWESLICVGMCYGLLAIFRAWFDEQGSVSRFLSANAFSVYVFHPPVLVLAARLLQGFSWPSIAMFLALCLTAAIATFALSAAVFRRIPLLGRIL